MRRRSRHAAWVLVGAALLASSAISCSKKEPRYPEDHARFLRIDAAVERLRTAYVEQDSQALGTLLLPSEPLEPLKRDIRKDFETFQSIDVEFTIDRITIDGDDIDVYLHWQGFWKRAPADVGLRDRGHGVLRWTGTQSILLKEVQGDLPFGMASRLLLTRPMPAVASSVVSSVVSRWTAG